MAFNRNGILGPETKAKGLESARKNRLSSQNPICNQNFNPKDSYKHIANDRFLSITRMQTQTWS